MIRKNQQRKPTIDSATGVCVTMRGVVDGTFPQLDGVRDGQVKVIGRVQDTVRKRGTGAHREQVALEARTIVVHVEQVGSLVEKVV